MRTLLLFSLIVFSLTSCDDRRDWIVTEKVVTTSTERYKTEILSRNEKTNVYPKLDMTLDEITDYCKPHSYKERGAWYEFTITTTRTFK